MKNTYGLSNAIVSKYYSSLVFILEELSENLTASEVKQQLSIKSKLRQEIIQKLSKIVDDNTSSGQAISTVKKKAIGSTLLDFEYKFLITAADSHINKNSG